MEKLLQTIVKAMDDKKGLDIVVLDISQVASFTDYFIICTGTSTTQIQTVADEVQERLRAQGSRPTHVEGYKVADWVLLDYGPVVAHIFSPKARSFYDLERLWRDGRRSDVAALLKEKPSKAKRHKAQ